MAEQPLLLMALPKKKLKSLLELHLVEAKNREQEIVQLLLLYVNQKDDKLLTRASIKLGSLTHELSSALNQLMWQIGLRYVLPDMASSQEFRSNFETRHDFPILNIGMASPSQLYKRFEATRSSIEPLDNICKVIEAVQPRNQRRGSANELSFLQALSEIRNSKAHTMIVEQENVSLKGEFKDNLGNKVDYEEAKAMGYELTVKWDDLEVSDNSTQYPAFSYEKCLFLKNPIEIYKFYYKIPDNEDVRRCIFCYTKGILNNTHLVMGQIHAYLES